MDDYGTSQSTLTYLKRLPLDELKIDRSFVQFADQSNADAVLVRPTINLVHELGLKVIAEGGDDQCLEFLRSAGCDLAQGCLVSPPVSRPVSLNSSVPRIAPQRRGGKVAESDIGNLLNEWRLTGSLRPSLNGSYWAQS
jgi:EAL domain-containing protein (putative c-di-GMP-specific phosphodiesterase class I)